MRQPRKRRGRYGIAFGSGSPVTPSNPSFPTVVFQPNSREGSFSLDGLGNRFVARAGGAYGDNDDALFDGPWYTNATTPEWYSGAPDVMVVGMATENPGTDRRWRGLMRFILSDVTKDQSSIKSGPTPEESWWPYVTAARLKFYVIGMGTPEPSPAGGTATGDLRVRYGVDGLFYSPTADENPMGSTETDARNTFNQIYNNGATPLQPTIAWADWGATAGVVTVDLPQAAIDDYLKHMGDETIYGPGFNPYLEIALILEHDLAEDDLVNFKVEIGAWGVYQPTLEIDFDLPDEPDPALWVSTTSVAMGPTATVLFFRIRNTGGGTLSWSVAESASWLVLSPTSDTNTGELDTVLVTVDRTGLAEGDHFANVTVTSNAGSATVSVSVNVPEVAPPPTPVLSVDPVSLDFEDALTSLTFEITNVGTGTLTWSITDDAAWLSCSPASGTTTVETDTITVTVDRTGIETGSYSATITVTSDGGTQEINVAMEAVVETAHYWLFVINDTQYNDIASNVTRFSGDPAYEGFVSLAQITQTKVTNWRNAFPGCKIIAYLILYNLQAESQPNFTMYDDLRDGLDDLWLRRVSDNAKVTLGGFFGHYFWNSTMLTNELVPWLQRSGTLLDWPTKYDGFYLDNLNWEAGIGVYEGLIAAHGALKVNGVQKSAAELRAMYAATSAAITAAVRSVLAAGKIIITNSAAYAASGQQDPIERPDPNINGILWEPTLAQAHQAEVFLNQPWEDNPDQYPCQYVNNLTQWNEIIAQTWDPSVRFMQNIGMSGRLPPP